MWWASSSGKIELFITKSQARKGYHSGACDLDIQELRQVPFIRRQLAKVCPTTLAAELAEYGAWDASELQDHEANLDRLLWIACADIVEENNF